MMKMNERQLYAHALANWGEKAQEGMLLEEMGEVLVAFNKRHRHVNGCSSLEFVEELVDLSIMIEQEKLILRILPEHWAEIKQKKLQRLARMLEVEYVENGV